LRSRSYSADSRPLSLIICRNEYLNSKAGRLEFGEEE
jgi:hypothetical protein